MTPAEQANLDNLQRAHDQLLEGYCGMSVAYMSHLIVDTKRTLEKQQRVITELRGKVLQLTDRMDRAADQFAALSKKVERCKAEIEAAGSGS